MIELLSRRVRLAARAGFVASMALAFAGPALAEYPDKPIKLIVPFAQGGATDQVGRMIAQPLEEVLGTSVAVVNQAGAGGAVGLANLSRARPDGYTLGIGSDSSLAARPLMTESGYTSESFAPIARLVEAPTGFAVASNSKYQDLKSLVEAMKSGQKVTWSSPGVGSGPHLAAETFFEKFGVQATHINAQSGKEALVKLLSGEVDFVSAAGSNFPAMVSENEGAIKVLGLAGEKRWPRMPDIPTFKEEGFDFIRSQWFGLVAPAGTPEDVVNKLATEVEKIMNNPESDKLLANFHFSSAYQGPEKFAEQIQIESKELAPVLQRIGMAKK
ncbi:Bug family tripartite tricarboxylate transporter substrate binding protein [Propylenella binzhouense]|uniref:Tripartite tricarboxylate transporter substrate binding protein n=1 Tax=Propylenella binzhouense TaxID=2555902 RepID=A0A964T404_9HYPH|nr:tripartite tricarboxylate transporter substrate binding protein [Propylenella binzhouense]MYZ47112.1 tripartite tricarboxylate transporter substrate binding protein [Propylenella binzhouense]